MSIEDGKPKEKRELKRDSDMDVSHSIGYMVAKLEGLDSYIRDHMRQEEAKFESIFKSIKRIQLAIMVIAMLVILMAAGVPIDGFMLKIIALIF